MINPAAASCFYHSEIYLFIYLWVECFIFKPVENALNLFLVSISLKTRCTHLSFKGYACVCICVCVCVSLSLSQIPMILPELAHSVSQQQQQKENQLRQILLGRKLSVRMMTG